MATTFAVSAKIKATTASSPFSKIVCNNFPTIDAVSLTVAGSDNLVALDPVDFVLSFQCNRLEELNHRNGDFV
jgi:hypothetical protein